MTSDRRSRELCGPHCQKFSVRFNRSSIAWVCWPCLHVHPGWNLAPDSEGGGRSFGGGHTSTGKRHICPISCCTRTYSSVPLPPLSLSLTISAPCLSAHPFRSSISLCNRQYPHPSLPRRSLHLWMIRTAKRVDPETPSTIHSDSFATRG